MALPRDFKLTVAARAQRDPKFRQALLTEAITAYLAGDTMTGKAVLRDLVKALQKKTRVRLRVTAELG